jgi:hypothetical protein
MHTPNTKSHGNIPPNGRKQHPNLTLHTLTIEKVLNTPSIKPCSYL